ncbi:unnamed protein product [Calypogeia fissa]
MVGEKENCCITLHQPWASLLVYGIKRIEGRYWSCPMRGRLWIHAASKIPENETVLAMEEFYRDAYALDGVTDIVFPKHYPTSVLLGCVDVVGCLYKEEVEKWDAVSAGVRMEAQTEFCWLCENPQKLVIPLEMRGRQGLYNLQNKLLEAAPSALRPAAGRPPVKFPRLDPSYLFSLEPGCLKGTQNTSGRSPSVKTASPKLDASIAGARAAASQFRKQDERVKQQGSTDFSSPGSANFRKSSFPHEQNFLDRVVDRRERGKTPEDDSTPINASRQAPRRVPACRIFDQAMGALGSKGPRKDQALKAGGVEKDEAV